MTKQIPSKPIISIFLLLLHIALGFIAANYSFAAMLWGVSVLILGFYSIIKNKNKNNEAAIWVAYYAGMEVLLRMADAEFTWEFAKYITILFLCIGMMVERVTYKRSFYWVFLMCCLLIPGIISTFTWSERIREDIAFNISGIITLCVCAAYFYKRLIGFENLMKIISYFLLPVISLGFVLFFLTPEIEDINFTANANFATSGGFGPNQVATVLGMGWLIILIFLLYRQKLTPFIMVTIILFAFILYRSLFTFSRGGNFTSILALVGFICVHFFYKKSTIISLRSFTLIMLACIVSYSVVIYLDTVTEGIFGNRFTGKNTAGEQKEDITTGRMATFEEEWQLFVANPMGVGVGGSRAFRTEEFGDTKATHNEFGRLLSEHGVFGAVIIFMLYYIPLSLFFKMKLTDSKAFLVLFMIIALGTMMHSAMRIALPAFFYGLALSVIIPLNYETHLHRQ